MSQSMRTRTEPIRQKQLPQEEKEAPAKVKKTVSLPATPANELEGPAAAGPEVDDGGISVEQAEKFHKLVSQRIEQMTTGTAGYAVPLQKLFKKYDESGSGELAPRDFRKLVRKELSLGPKALPDASVKVLFEALDADRGGTVSIDELIRFVHAGPEAILPDSEELERRQVLHAAEIKEAEAWWAATEADQAVRELEAEAFVTKTEHHAIMQKAIMPADLASVMANIQGSGLSRWEALFVAIKDLDEPSAVALLGSSGFSNINVKDEDGLTALHLAASKNLGSVCRSILNHDVFVAASEHCQFRWTALHLAARYDCVVACSELLTHPRFREAVLLKDQDGRTALHIAAYYGNMRACWLLLSCGLGGEPADIKDQFGCTALHYAAEEGHALVCWALLQSPGFRRFNARDNNGCTALHHAAASGHSAACAALLTHPTRSPKRDVQSKRGYTAEEVSDPKLSHLFAEEQAEVVSGKARLHAKDAAVGQAVVLPADWQESRAPPERSPPPLGNIRAQSKGQILVRWQMLAEDDIEEISYSVGDDNLYCVKAVHNVDEYKKLDAELKDAVKSLHEDIRLAAPAKAESPKSQRAAAGVEVDEMLEAHRKVQESFGAVGKLLQQEELQRETAAARERALQLRLSAAQARLEAQRIRTGGDPIQSPPNEDLQESLFAQTPILPSTELQQKLPVSSADGARGRAVRSKLTPGTSSSGRAKQDAVASQGVQEQTIYAAFQKERDHLAALSQVHESEAAAREQERQQTKKIAVVAEEQHAELVQQQQHLLRHLDQQSRLLLQLKTQNDELQVLRKERQQQQDEWLAQADNQREDLAYENRKLAERIEKQDKLLHSMLQQQHSLVTEVAEQKTALVEREEQFEKAQAAHEKQHSEQWRELKRLTKGEDTQAKDVIKNLESLVAPLKKQIATQHSDLLGLMADRVAMESSTEALQSSKPGASGDLQRQLEEVLAMQKQILKKTTEKDLQTDISDEDVDEEPFLDDTAANWNTVMEQALAHRPSWSALPVEEQGEHSEPLALHNAARCNDASQCLQILESSPERRVIRDSNRRTALHVAAAYGFADVCEALLASDAFLGSNQQDIHGRTALHCAAEGGHAEVCSVLLSHGRFGAASLQDAEGCTALHAAACYGQASVCQVLVHHPRGVPEDIVDNDGKVAAEVARGAAFSVFRRRARAAKKSRSSTATGTGRLSSKYNRKDEQTATNDEAARTQTTAALSSELFERSLEEQSALIQAQQDLLSMHGGQGGHQPNSLKQQLTLTVQLQQQLLRQQQQQTSFLAQSGGIHTAVVAALGRLGRSARETP
eukprot:TRINITY_DN24392_c0_g1_i3.p1 TRINITY_DN24392_c0_g1~~TRINITY_DN24392_c0_g1_i3.p1  ORF type:complete len:1312 (+),score=295.63 TRINITY_DN24392_c0_g1_i3:121-4056(+)